MGAGGAGLYWLVTGVFGLAGILGLGWALFGDRSRGRRRCPKCWYDLSGAATITCSECGHVPAHERKLCKTRRRWRWALVFAVVLVAGVGGALAPKVRRDGWVSIAPTTVLVLAAGAMDTAPAAPPVAPPGPGPAIGLVAPAYADPLCDELMRRMGGEKLWRWQWRLLAWMCRRDDDHPPWRIEVVTRDRWPDGVTALCVAVFECNADRWPWFAPPRHRAVVRRRHDAGRAFTVPANWWGNIDVETMGWWEWDKRFAELPDLDAGPQLLEFAVSIERRFGSATGDDVWKPIASEVVRVPVSVGGSIDEVLPPSAAELPQVETLLRRHLRLRLKDGSLNIAFKFGPPKPAGGLTLAGHLELRRDGERVATARFRHLGGRLVLDQLRVVGGEEAESPGGVWSVRFRSDAELALEDFRADRYWSGDFTSPLVWQPRFGWLQAPED